MKTGKDMSETIQHWLILLALLLVYLIIGFLVGYKCGKKPPQTIEKVKMDTITVYDTIFKEKPIPKLVYKDRWDTVFVHTIQNDTVLAEVKIERKVYQEDSLYYASVSGFRASLDTLIVFPKTTTITIDRVKVVQPRKYSFGVTAGPSALITPNGKIHGGAGITAGLTIRL